MVRIFSQEWKEALWDSFVMGRATTTARRQSCNKAIAGFARAAEPGIGQIQIPKKKKSPPRGGPPPPQSWGGPPGGPKRSTVEDLRPVRKSRAPTVLTEMRRRQ